MSTDYNRIMLDLETKGTRPGCAILSIGAVFFSTTCASMLGPRFYSAIEQESCKAAGLVEDPETMKWWAKQGIKAREVWDQVKVAPPLDKVLDAFSEFVITQSADPKSVQMWGNGADFDNPILAAAYDALGRGQPWGSFSGRCYRTLKALMPSPRILRTGTHHNALDDAVSQAEHAVLLLKLIKG